MKKSVTGILVTSAVLSSITAFAQTPSVYLNGEEMTFEAAPYISEERTMVPFRAIFEAVDADVMWDEETKTVIAVKSSGEETTSIALQIGSDTAFVNGATVTLDKPAEITSDFTFVPLRFVMESLGADVKWDQDSYSVTITTN